MSSMYQVLIVDDEEIVCRGMAQFVRWEEHGFCAAGTATSVDEALVMLKKMHIDVIFTDIRMPKRSGIDLIREVHSLYPNIQSVILSGYSDFEYAKEAMRYGAVEYLSKPVNFSEVADVLERIAKKLERRTSEERLRSYHIEGLLLSIAKGFSDVQPEACGLPKVEAWRGISASMTKKTMDEGRASEEKAKMRARIQAVISDAIVLNSGMYTVFAVIPSKAAGDFKSFVSFLEQAECGADVWKITVSSEKYGIEKLREAWEEINPVTSAALLPAEADDETGHLSCQKPGGIIYEIQNFICGHYCENISLNMLADQFFIHPNYLSRLFKEKTGKNFAEYLTEVRMNRVLELLKNSDYKMLEICQMVGYDNPRSFSKAFKHYTGLTPSEYRESSREV